MKNVINKLQEIGLLEINKSNILEFQIILEKNIKEKKYNIEKIKDKLQNSNIKVLVDLNKELGYDMLIYDNEVLKEELKVIYKENKKNLKKDFPDLF